MKEGLYEIVVMRRSNRGKWVFTARPVESEISFECKSAVMEEDLFQHSREPLWLYFEENRERTVFDHFETEQERRASNDEKENFKVRQS